MENEYGFTDEGETGSDVGRAKPPLSAEVTGYALCGRFNVAMFTLYSVLFEGLVWGIFGYAVFWQGHSGWWIIPAFLLSGAQLEPKHFGIGGA